MYIPLIMTVSTSMVFLVTEGVVAWIAGFILAISVIWLISVFIGSLSNSNSKNNDWLPTPPPIRSGVSKTIKPNSLEVNFATKDMTISGNNDYLLNVVGTSQYQANLELLAGPKKQTSKNLYFEAYIYHEPYNKYDSNACAVIINNRKVGYLPRAKAKKLVSNIQLSGFNLKAKALIVGGWLNKRDEGNYGVRLDYDLSVSPAFAHLPATDWQKELYRFLGNTVSKTLTRGEATEFERNLSSISKEKAEEWRTYKLAGEYLQSKEGQEDYGISKPSLKRIRDAYSSLIKSGIDKKLIGDSEIYEELIELFPGLED